MEKHVNWSLNLTRIGPHQEINEVEPVNRIDWFVHGYLMNWFNPASAAKKKTHLAQPITLNNRFMSPLHECRKENVLVTTELGGRRVQKIT